MTRSRHPPSRVSRGVHRLVACVTCLLVLAACRPAPVEPATPAPTSGWRIHTHGTRPGHTFLALHDNENDAVLAARGFVDVHGGRLVEVRAQGTRQVTVTRDGRSTTFDPNRVFTDAGLLGPASLEGATRPVGGIDHPRAFARHISRAVDLDTASLLVAVHNNTDGAYSAASYAAGAALAGDAAALHLPSGVDPDDFFLVTTRALFDALRTSGFPVVLQDNARVTDDGSLSVLCGRRGIAYVNVEAQHGHADVQRVMLDTLHRALAASTGPARR